MSFRVESTILFPTKRENFNGSTPAAAASQENDSTDFDAS
jgi:hypothetical protein